MHIQPMLRVLADDTNFKVALVNMIRRHATLWPEHLEKEVVFLYLKWRFI